MVVLFSLTMDAKLRIVSTVRSHSDEVIAIAATPNEIVALARQNNPIAIFVFMPGKEIIAMDIQNFLRELMPHVRIRILPALPGTDELLQGWQGVVVDALGSTVHARTEASQ